MRWRRAKRPTETLWRMQFSVPFGHFAEAKKTYAGSKLTCLPHLPYGTPSLVTDAAGKTLESVGIQDSQQQ